jgi:serine/threonine protein kinase
MDSLPDVLETNEPGVDGGGAQWKSSASGMAVAPVFADRLGRYQLCLELDRGGMATVHLARVEGRAGIHRFVAVKVLHRHLVQDPEFIAMFADEARIASSVQHANLCSVIDFEASDAGYYLVMEYLAGEPLSALFKAMARHSRGSPAHRSARIARVIADACEGLHAAHELTNASGEPLGVVHRDISPDNVFVTYDGVAKIVDFGVASATVQQHRTRTGIIKGKYAYLAPEVLTGEKADRRADVWSLGVVLWELLTVQRLFLRDSELETLKCVSELAIPAPSKVRPGLPSIYDRIVLKALARDPDDRYATARELGRDLVRALARKRVAVGLADLAAWMDELFPSGRASKQRLLEIATRIEESTIIRESPAFYDAQTRIHRPLEGATRPRNARSFATALGAFKPRRSAFLAGGIAVLLLGSASAGALWRPTSNVRPQAVAGVAPEASPAPVEARSVRVGGSPYVVEIERAANSDPDGVVVRIRADVNSDGTIVNAERAEAKSEVKPAPPATVVRPPPQPVEDKVEPTAGSPPSRAFPVDLSWRPISP